MVSSVFGREHDGLILNICNLSGILNVKALEEQYILHPSLHASRREQDSWHYELLGVCCPP